jgi:hypothetical protein
MVEFHEFKGEIGAVIIHRALLARHGPRLAGRAANQNISRRQIPFPPSG